MIQPIRSRTEHVSRLARRVVMTLALSLAACASDAAERGALVARDAALTGSFEAYVVDHADGSYRESYALRLDSGERVELVFAGRPSLHSGERALVRGQFVASERPLSTRDDLRLGARRFEVTEVSASALARTEQALVHPPNVTVTSAVVLLDFNGMAAQNYTADDARRELAEVHDYYQEISYGSWTMNADVFGPYLVDTPAQCDLGALGDLAKATARAQGVDIDGYDHVGVKIAGIPGADCPCAVAFLGNTPAQGSISNGGVSLYTCSGANAYAHEMGHGIGLGHSSTAPCHGVAYRPGLSGCDIVEYGNRFNTMGGGLGHFNAMQKATLGWLNGCNIRRVQSDGEFDLTAIQLAADEEAQGLQIDTGDTLSGGPLYFYVEYRNPALAQFNARKDDGNPRERGPGLHVTVSRDFRSTQGEGRTILIDASNGLKGLPTDGSDADQARGDPRLLVGESFAPNDRVRIDFVSQTDQVAHVKVTFTGGGAGENACQSSQVPIGPDDVPDGFAAVIYQDCGYAGGWSANLQEGRYTTAQLASLGALDNDASSLLLAPGYDALLYEQDDFLGTPITRRSSLGCFTQVNLNDALSSIEIVSNGSVPPDAGPSRPDGSSGGDGTPQGDGAADGDGSGGDGAAHGDGAGGADGESGDGATDAPGKGGGCTLGPRATPGQWPGALAALSALLVARRRRRPR